MIAIIILSFLTLIFFVIGGLALFQFMLKRTANNYKKNDIIAMIKHYQTWSDAKTKLPITFEKITGNTVRIVTIHKKGYGKTGLYKITGTIVDKSSNQIRISNWRNVNASYINPQPLTNDWIIKSDGKDLILNDGSRRRLILT